MRLYRNAAGEWFGTQEAAGKGFVRVDFPEVKADVIAWLNRNVRPFGGKEVTAVWVDEAGSLPPAVPTAETFDATDALDGKYGPGDFIPGPGQVEEIIGKAEGNVLAGYALAAVCRVGEIKGVSLAAFRHFCRMPGRAALDRGMLRIGAVALIDAAGE